MLERVYWGQALGGDAADQVLKQMAAGLVSEVAMARMTETEARRGLDAIRETAAGVSSRFVDQTARQEFDRAAGDLVRLVEDRISVKLTADVSGRETRPPPARPAGGGGSAPARGEGGPSARQELDDRSSESGREIDETGRASDRRTGQGGRRTHLRGRTGFGSGRPAAGCKGALCPLRRRMPAKRSCASGSSASALRAATSSAEGSGVDAVCRPASQPSGGHGALSASSLFFLLRLRFLRLCLAGRPTSGTASPPTRSTSGT